MLWKLGEAPSHRNILQESKRKWRKERKGEGNLEEESISLSETSIVMAHPTTFCINSRLQIS